MSSAWLEEAHGANRISGMEQRNRLLNAPEANYDDDDGGAQADFVGNAPALGERMTSERAGELGYRFDGLDAHMNLEGDGEGGQQFNQNWMTNNWNVGTSVGGIGRFSNGGADFQRDGGEGIPLFRQMLDAENGRPVRPQSTGASPAAAARPRKRNFFKRLWSWVRGKGWK